MAELSEQSRRRLHRLMDERQRAKKQAHDLGARVAAAMVETKEREGLTVRELAEGLGMSTSTVQDWLARGRNKR